MAQECKKNSNVDITLMLQCLSNAEKNLLGIIKSEKNETLKVSKMLDPLKNPFKSIKGEKF